MPRGAGCIFVLHRRKKLRSLTPILRVVLSVLVPCALVGLAGQGAAERASERSPQAYAPDLQGVPGIEAEAEDGDQGEIPLYAIAAISPRKAALEIIAGFGQAYVRRLNRSEHERCHTLRWVKQRTFRRLCPLPPALFPVVIIFFCFPH